MTATTATASQARELFNGFEITADEVDGHAHRVATFTRVLADGSTAAFIRPSCAHCDEQAAALAAWRREGDLRSIEQQDYRATVTDAELADLAALLAA